MFLRFFTLMFVLSLAAPVRGQDALPTPAPLNFPTATLGGTQFWSDELVFREWRIQQNALTGHCRLLDDRDFRMAWGSYDQCRAKLNDLKRERDLKPLAGRGVVLLHGLIRSRDTMAGLGEYLEAEASLTPINISYASTRRSLDEHAQSLARVIAGLEGIGEINFVCHSLGNLVVRRYLGEASQPQPRWQPDPRIKRMVMLGPPNNGAQLARFGKNNKLFALVAGPSGKALHQTWDETAKLLATPSFEFAIVAGGQSNERGINPLVAGDDDLLVSVEETKLPGACDFLVLPRWHSQLMDDPESRAAIRNFLDHGYFISADHRLPVPAVAAGSERAAAP